MNWAWGLIGSKSRTFNLGDFLFRIEVVSGIGQLKSFLRDFRSDHQNPELIFLKNLISEKRETRTYKLWIAYGRSEREILGRVAACIDDCVGHIFCFSSSGNKILTKALVNKALNFLEDNKVFEVCAPSLPHPYPSLGIKEGDPLVDQFLKLGFLPKLSRYIVKEKLSIVLKSKEVKSLQAPYQSVFWGFNNWEDQVSAATNIINSFTKNERRYISEQKFEETLFSYGSPANLLGITLFEGKEPVGFMVTKTTRINHPRFGNFKFLFPLKCINTVEVIFLETIYDPKTPTAKNIENELWRHLGSKIKIVNRDNQDPLVVFSDDKNEHTVNKIVLTKIFPRVQKIA